MGHIVLYQNGVGKQSPAIVSDVIEHDNEEPSLHLTTFENGAVRYRTGVQHGNGFGQWQWPDIPISPDHTGK